MINCIVIDDEPKALDILKRYIDKIDFLHLSGLFREPLKALELLQSNNVDLIFLDINMPDLSGIDFKKTMNSKAMVIFTTAYSEYAIESYNLNVTDYLLKPISFDRFLKAVNRVVEQFYLKKGKLQSIKRETAYVFIKSGPQLHQVKVNDILFLQKDGNYIEVNLKDKKIIVRENMSDIFDIIPKVGFIRIHKSFVVALKHIETIESEQLIINKVKIPIGITFREQFLKAIEELKGNT